MGQTPKPPADHVRVPSFKVDRRLLRSWGFEVAGCSASHDTTPGMPLHEARHLAWEAGWTEQRSGPWTAKAKPTPDPEMTAWGLAQKGVTDA